ncbi:MAG: tRNA pseudouridine(13) synthase TruD [Phycisphaerae bacterium]|nr:tRNA pseudouridine(13) synthase TruD [Phycisphaerae bacterium]
MTIRRKPEDFLVTERLNPVFRAAFTAAWGAAATHAVYELTKTSMTTPDAIQSLAREVNTRHADVGYAGLKDKHARTIQNLSLPVERAEHAAALPREIVGRGWSARLIAWSPREITADAIDGNGFTIIVRSLSREACDEMGRRAHLLTITPRPATDSRKSAPAPTRGRVGVPLLITNYFGDQRFGSARHGQGWAALPLIKGDFDAALRLAVGTPARKDSGRTRQFTRLCAEKWGRWKELAQQLPRCPERKPFELLAQGKEPREAFAALPYLVQTMCVEAFQSHLWNETARRLMLDLVKGYPDGAKPLRSEDIQGELVFIPASAVHEDIRTLDMPILAANTTLQQPWANAAREVLREKELTQDQLKIPGLRRPFFGEAPRQVFVRAERYTAAEPEPDELDERPKRLKRTLTFDLPRGSYATILLRALGQ